VMIDDAIQLVRAFDDHDEAIACASNACGFAEQWAVVDLTSMTVTARGSCAEATRPTSQGVRFR
jgi:hypothetical protein